MTQRHNIVSILFKELLNTASVFGVLTPGTPQQPAIERTSVHYLSKEVSGQPLRRPPWYFDVTQQGEGIVDVTTHMVDAIMWTGFPEQAFDYATDIKILQARRWPTMLTREQFAHITGVHEFPESLHRTLDHGILPYSCNGEMLYTLKGVYTKVQVVWHVEAPAGSGDTHTVVTRGTRSTLYIRQGAAQHYRPELYVEPMPGVEAAEIETALRHTIAALQRHYPGVEVHQQKQQWHVQIPDSYRLGHEAQFGKVAQTFLHHVQQGALPTWELPNLLSKYYITTQALALARAETRA
jgi:predicted dehydrogenase